MFYEFVYEDMYPSIMYNIPKIAQNYEFSNLANLEKRKIKDL